jgi:hypothetical protein
MKDKRKLLKTKQGSGKEKLSKERSPAKLYAVCLNKPLIELWAMSDRYSNDYYDTSERYKGSVYAKSFSSLKSDDRIPVILSPDDEMMLYNEGLSEYY